jgi:hypothetical protein
MGLSLSSYFRTALLRMRNLSPTTKTNSVSFALLSHNKLTNTKFGLVTRRIDPMTELFDSDGQSRP